MKHIGVIGSRRRNSMADYCKLRRVFFEFFERGDIIISGGCSKGGDRFAEIIAREEQIPIMIFYAWWNGPAGKTAGFQRNTDIVQMSDIIIALRAPDKTGGTEDSLRKAYELGIRIICIRN